MSDKHFNKKSRKLKTDIKCGNYNKKIEKLFKSLNK